MAIGIGIGMSISGPSQHNVTGWFEIDNACGFVLPTRPAWTDLLIDVPYIEGNYVQTKITGPYTGKRILLGKFQKTDPLSPTYVGVQPGSLVYNVCDK